MSYEILPLRLRDSRVVVGASLLIETPNEPIAELEIQQLFQECGSDLERRQEEGGSGMSWIQVVMRSTEGLAPPNSDFLEALCGFLSEHPFDLGARNAPSRDPRLYVRVDDSQEDTGRSDEDETKYAEATSRICGAFWQNNKLRSAYSKVMNVRYILSQEVIDRFLLDTQDGDFFVVPPLYRVALIARGPRAEPSDVLQVDVAGVCLAAVGTEYAASVMDQALSLFRRELVNLSRVMQPAPRFVVASERVASIVAHSLQQHQRRPTPLSSIHLVAGTQNNLEMLDVDAPPLDGMNMIRNALKSQSLTLEGFRLSGGLALSSTAESEEIGVPGDPTLCCLTLHRCDLSDPVGGAGAFWSFLQSQGVALEDLRIADMAVPLDEMEALCRALANRNGSLRYLQLGSTPSYPPKEEPSLCVDSVRHFFDTLPSMVSLRSLVFYHKVPAHLNRTVVDAVRDNYWLTELQGLFSEEVDDDDEREAMACLRREINAYVTANARGRSTVYGASFVMARGSSDPDERRFRHRIVGAALRVLEDLAGSEEIGDATTRFLCLRLFLPALGGGAANRMGGLPRLSDG